LDGGSALSSFELLELGKEPSEDTSSTSDPEGDLFFLVLCRLPDVVAFKLEAFDLLPVSDQLFSEAFFAGVFVAADF
jgi:hypothetical protein